MEAQLNFYMRIVKDMAIFFIQKDFITNYMKLPRDKFKYVHVLLRLNRLIHRHGNISEFCLGYRQKLKTKTSQWLKSNLTFEK